MWALASSIKKKSYWKGKPYNKNAKISKTFCEHFPQIVNSLKFFHRRSDYIVERTGGISQGILKFKTHRKRSFIIKGKLSIAPITVNKLETINENITDKQMYGDDMPITILQLCL